MGFMEDNAKSSWPARAVVTAGMPYGNKALHFGHVGGVFVPADTFARFLRDRIGAENVRFVSGTDCFGSPIDEGYRKLCEAGEFEGSIYDYVKRNHDIQKHTLDAYNISLDIYQGSALGHAADVHQSVSEAFITRLYERGFLKRQSTLQFFDAQAQTFLNGRQVQGHCPVQGCKSEKAYADECDLGHQYDPADLLNPVSSVSGTVPEMRPVENWYFDLPAFVDYLREYTAQNEQDETLRTIVPQTVKEFLGAPVTYIKNELLEAYQAIAAQLPPHVFHEAEKGKQSFGLEFESVEARDEARSVLSAAGIRFRTGKALVPFRITGNIAWGVKAPELEGVTGLSVWCWPESLWAPISFTIARNDELGLPKEAWRSFWCSDDAQVYQFIGQDNLYFYGVAQPALFEALRPGTFDGGEEPLRQTKLIANHHVLFGKTKASSSSEVKPPSADALLDYYTPEQLRAHWLALGLDQKSVGFSPKPFDPDVTKREDPRYADPVLKEGALLTNVFNRLARSVLYEAAKSFNGAMPLGAVSEELLAEAHKLLLDYDEVMQRAELHTALSLSDTFIRSANKLWADGIRTAQNENDDQLRRQVLIDCFYALRVASLVMHPIVPVGCEKICSYLNFDAKAFFSWAGSFDGLEELCSPEEIAQGAHPVQELPPRFDFFEKHPSQFK